jgi:tetratricopeptide (TPR) repeat protein
LKTSALAVALSVLAWGARPAQAAPSIWERAAKPEAARSQVLLNRVERMMGTLGLPGLGPEFSEGAVAMFQLSDRRWTCAAPATRAASQVEPYLDPRLEYLIGEALLDSQTGREADARCILERALRDAPDSPLAADGWSDLGVAAGILADYRTERMAYARALDRSWDTEDRARLYVDLAESDMALGDLKRAVREYRVALQSSQQPEHLSAAYFGLAVALDRSGDFPAALTAAEQAVSVPLPQTLFQAQSVLDLPNVFFTPGYEVHYYKALRAMATAELAKDNTARRDALADAVEEWTAYLVRAEADRSPWVQPAKLHKARVERELSKLPPPPKAVEAQGPSDVSL